MSHLLVELIRQTGQPVALLALLVAGVGGAVLAVWIPSGFSRTPQRRTSLATSLRFAAAFLAITWMVFRIAFNARFPQLPFRVPPACAVPASFLMLITASIAAALQHSRQHSARNALLAGSLLSCSVSCLVFTSMAGLVAPYALAYDLPAVLATMVLGAALCAYALREGANELRRYRVVVCAVVLALALAELVMGSLAAILPFGEWITASMQTDSLASSPVVVISVTEGLAVFAFGLFGSLLDNRVAARDRLEAERVRQLADSAMEGLLIHHEGRILDGNISFAELVGRPLAELRRGTIEAFLPAGNDAQLWSPNLSGNLAETEILFRDGSRIPVEILSRPMHYGNRTVTVTALRDLRERRASEKRIRFLAHHDPLTELPNRLLLGDTLNTALRQAIRKQTPLAALCLDLDGFKGVNDTLGHSGGDTLLRMVAQRLNAILAETDFLARIGGDEFVILQLGGAGPEQARLIGQRIIEELSQPFTIDGHDVSIGTSIGIALYPQDADTADTLLKQADTALYRAKELGRGIFCFFETGMEMAQRKRCEMERELRQAVKDEVLTIHFQPLFNNRRELVTFEALLRWTHATLGPIPPADFIPLAEESGLIVPLGEWVLRAACQAAVSWQNECRIAVNLSPAQFLRGNIPDLVRAVLAETGLPPHRLELELTENILIGNTDEALRQLLPLREMGVRLVLDDFGTGYSSLSYLHKFPFDKIKVDRSFIRNLETDKGVRAIVNAIITMSHNLDLEVTAEGVETIEQFELLRAQGCHELQGFLLGKPMPNHEAIMFQEGRVLEQEEIRIKVKPTLELSDQGAIGV